MSIRMMTAVLAALALMSGSGLAQSAGEAATALRERLLPVELSVDGEPLDAMLDQVLTGFATLPDPPDGRALVQSLERDLREGVDAALSERRGDDALFGMETYLPILLPLIDPAAQQGWIDRYIATSGAAFAIRAPRPRRVRALTPVCRPCRARTMSSAARTGRAHILKR